MLLAPLLALLLTSCGGEDAATESGGEFAIDKTTDHGPVSVTLRLTKKELTLAERLTLVLAAEAEEEYDVALPTFGDKLDQFAIVDYHSPPPRLVDGGRVRVERSYELEPFLSGDYTIPPMKITFSKKGEEKKHEAETEEVTVVVKSILPDDKKDLAIRDIAGAVALPRPSRAWIVWTGAGSLAGIALLGVLWRRLRRRGDEAQAVASIAAHELAWRQIEALVAEDLIGAGDIKGFTQRLSHILRLYIENRFGLHAPERTTEEFLDELRGSDALEARFRPPLEEFLSCCDLVKFAEFQPTTSDIQKMFDTTKQFIEATRVEDRTVTAA
ncbi:hypothetical protein HQ560_05625 [bacterium]|nr:hypothetical protein [bacterium]